MKTNVCVIYDNARWSPSELDSSLRRQGEDQIEISMLDFAADFQFRQSLALRLSGHTIQWPDTATMIFRQFGIIKSLIHQQISNIAKTVKQALIPSEECHLNPWYLGLVHEKNPHKTNVFFELAVNQIIQAHLQTQTSTRVILAVMNRQILREIRDFCRSRGLAVTLLTVPKERSLKDRVRRIMLFFDYASALSPWVKHVLRKLMAFTVERSTESKSQTLFVTYFPYFDEEHLSPQALRTHFTPGLEDIFAAEKINPVWIAMYVPFNGTSYWQSLKKARVLSRKDVTVRFLERYLRWTDFLYAWKLWIKIRRKAAPFLKSNAAWFDQTEPFHLNREFWKTSLMRSILMQGILQYLAFKRALGQNGQAKTLLYLCEMQAWEKAMLMAAENFTPRIQSFGFQHSSVSTNYFNYFYEKAENTPGPDHFLTNSPSFKTKFEEFLPSVKIVEALRQNSLLAAINSQTDLGDRPYFSVFSNFAESNTVTLLKFLRQTFEKNQPPFKILLKLHPSLNYDVNYLLFPGLELTRLTAAKILEMSFGCLVPDSTVALEALAIGIPCITPLFSNEIPLSPMLDYTDCGKIVTTPADLAIQTRILYENRDRIDHKKMTAELQRMWKLDKDMPLWRQLVRENLI